MMDNFETYNMLESLLIFFTACIMVAEKDYQPMDKIADTGVQYPMLDIGPANLYPMSGKGLLSQKIASVDLPVGPDYRDCFPPSGVTRLLLMKMAQHLAKPPAQPLLVALFAVSRENLQNV